MKRPVYFCPSCRLFWGWEDRGMGRAACGTPRDKWCGQCYANVRGRANHAGHVGYRPPSPRKAGDLLSLHKPSSSGAGSRSEQSPSSQSSYLGLFSDTLAFLSSGSWPDGSKRAFGTLTLTVTGGRWSARLKDPNGKRYCYLSADNVDSLLEAIEKGLGTDQMDWREDKPFRAR